MRSASGGYRLEAPEMLESVDEVGDGVTLQILTVFPGFVLQQIMNCLAVRQVLPKGVGGTELVWTAFGYAGDNEKMSERRMKQSNLVGPAGYISLEDGAATGFVQRGVAGASVRASVVEMGGGSIESNESRITEASVRGFWKQYRSHMDL
jgi:anthranilate 1,2-dioxygenase large subunit/terephthalate 1,2-dioxygenase oxygenase component alpha subunit